VNLCLAHPGGGKLQMELTGEEARRLIADLAEKIA